MTRLTNHVPTISLEISRYGKLKSDQKDLKDTHQINNFKIVLNRRNIKILAIHCCHYDVTSNGILTDLVLVVGHDPRLACHTDCEDEASS